MPNNIEHIDNTDWKPKPGEVAIRCKKQWHLEVAVVCGESVSVGYPQNIEITLADNKNHRGTTRFRDTRVAADSHSSPNTYVLSGQEEDQVFVSAASKDDNTPWCSAEEADVELTPKKTTVVTLALTPARRLRLRLQRAGRPFDQLDWTLQAAEQPVIVIIADKHGGFTTHFPIASTDTAKLYFGKSETASIGFVVVFSPLSNKVVRERARLQNLGLYPPNRVTPFNTETDADEVYQHALALGAYLEKERSFTGSRLGEVRERHTLTDFRNMAADGAWHPYLHRSHVEDEFAPLTGTVPVKNWDIPCHLTGGAGKAYCGREKAKGALAEFHTQYLSEGWGEAATLAPTLKWEDHALAIEQATTTAQCDGECKGAMILESKGKAECPDCFGLGLQPKDNPVFYRSFREHLVKCVKLCRDWNEVKQRCLDGYIAPEGKGSQDRDAVEAAKVKPRESLMRALIAFRNHYIKSMVQALADKGLALVSQAVGSSDLTSDYDVTLAGDDDADAFAEINAAFRQAWGKESGVVFDTNFYFLREWVAVGNNIVKNGRVDFPGDRYTQLEMDEQVGDLYGLAKLRRYTSKKEWDEFVKAVCRSVEVDGLRGADIPMFGRVEMVDSIYRKQYVEPLLRRLGELKTRWAADVRERRRSMVGTPEFEETLTKSTPRTLERLIHFDRNAVLRECNMAYLEIITECRKAEAAIKAAYEETPGVKLKRIWRKTMQLDDAELEGVNSGLSAAGLYQRNRVCGRLFSEAHFFAAESYTTQAAMKDVVANQGKYRVKLHFTPYEFLQCFNEQVGDGLKEIREYQRMVDEDVEYKKGIGHKEVATTQAEYIGVGFYRASKYEIRMAEVLEALHKSLATGRTENVEKQEPGLVKDPRIERRMRRWAELFPGKADPDKKDLDLLEKEVAMAKLWETPLKDLLKLRKSQAPYNKLTEVEKREKAKKLIGDFITSKPFTDANDAEDRQGTKPKFENSKYDPKGTEWGLRHLTEYLLHHCAQVNQVTRRLLSRAELEIYAEAPPTPSSTD